MSRHFSAISMNEKLFARIDALYSQARGARSSMPRRCACWRRPGRVSSAPARSSTPPARSGWRRSTRSSPRSARDSARTCWPTRRDWVLFIDEADLAGLPDFLRERHGAGGGIARREGHVRRHLVALDLRAVHQLFSDAATCANRPGRPSFAVAKMAARPTMARSLQGRWRCAPKRRSCSATTATRR